MRCRKPQHYKIAILLLCVLSLVAKAVYGSGDPLTPGTPYTAYPYIIDETDKCPGGKEAPFLVQLITVEAHQVDRRDAIRESWGNERLGLLPSGRQPVVRLFLLGGVKAGEQGRLQQRALESESLRYHDIIQQDFQDSYNNLTLKTLLGLGWVATRCPRASFVLKTDSDMFINTKYLVDKLLKLKPGVENYITGAIAWANEAQRDKSSKFYMSKEDYPSDTYPAHPRGGAYVLSGDLAAKVYNASLRVPSFRFEDVHVGMRLAELGVGPTPSPPGEFNMILVPWSYDRYSRLVATHGVSPNDMLEFWIRLQQAGSAFPH